MVNRLKKERRNHPHFTIFISLLNSLVQSPFALILAHLVLGLNLASISNSVPIEVTDQLAKTKPSEFVAEESLFKDEEEEVVETAYVVGPDQIAVESKELLSSLEKDEIMPETLLEKAQALVEAQLVPRAGEGIHFGI